MVARIRNVEIAGCVKGQAVGRIQGCLDGRAKVTCVAMAAENARNGGDVPRERINAPHSIVAGVREVQVAGSIQRDGRRVTDRGPGSRSTIAGRSNDAVAGDGGYNFGLGVDLPDAVVARVCNKEVSGSVYSKSEGQKDGCLGGGCAVSAIDPRLTAGDSGDGSGNKRADCAGRGTRNEAYRKRGRSGVQHDDGTPPLTGEVRVEAEVYCAALPGQVRRALRAGASAEIREVKVLAPLRHHFD